MMESPKFCNSLLAVCLALAAVAARAADPADVLPDVPRLDSVPSPSEFFGFEIGSRHLRHDQIVDYLHALADASDRVTLIPYATSHGGRPLLVAAISSAENTARLENIRRSQVRVTQGRSAEVESDALLVMYMGYGVHGDEASAMNAAPIVAYHLASAQSEQVDRWLAASFFLIDPALNPDGNDRFANWSNAARGRFPSDQAVDREHNQPWPGGRTNYYWFDLNRDWLPLVHPESRGRLRLFHQWKPNVVLDFHEMSGASSFFFQPGIPERNNPFTPKKTFELTRQFAEHHARSMDDAVELFFTEERFDDFYAGKGSTYPDLHGAIGILFEQGSTRGLQLKNERTDRTFANTVANQVRTSLSSLRAAGDLKEELLEHQRRFYADALQSGREDELTAYVLTGEPTRVAAAADVLRAHRIRCWTPESEIRLDGETYMPQSALVVPLAQPEVTFLRSLLEPLQDFEENVFYDVSTWHLPSAMDVQLHRFTSDLPASWSAAPRGTSADDTTDPAATPSADEGTDAGAFQRRDEAIGYAIDPAPLQTPRVIARLHRVEADVRVTTQPMEIGSEPGTRRWRAGTFLVLRQPNKKTWERILNILQRAAEVDGVVAQPLTSSMTLAGPDLGSDTALRLPTCKPLLVVGPGTSAYTAGALWHHLDIRMGQPTTVVDTSDFRNAKMHEYTCVILPEGSYGAWGDAEVDQLRRYAESGGTIIGVSSAARWLDRHKLISIPEDPTEQRNGEPQKDGEREQDDEADRDAEPEAAPEQQAPQFGEAADRAALESIAGAFFSARVDPTHPLAFGLPDDVVPAFRDHTLRFPAPENPYQTVARYEGVIAGYVSERNRDRLAGTAAAWIDPLSRGRVIVLADNPVFRGYVRSTERLLTNAILLGPVLQIPAAPVTDASPDPH